MKRLFKRIIPQRVNKRSFIGTIISLIAVLLMMNYLVLRIMDMLELKLKIETIKSIQMVIFMIQRCLVLGK